MAIFSTGPIENSPVLGIRPAQQVTVKVVNQNPVTFASILIQGYILNGSRTIYVLELLSVAPNQVITRNYFADLNGYEFVFETALSPDDYSVEVSVWGKTASGQLVDAHRLVAQENFRDDEIYEI